MANSIAAGLAFTEEDCQRVIQEAWGRFTGQPATMSVSQNWRSPGLFGLIQRRRAHLFKLPSADPVLPTEMGEYPHFQSDYLRATHLEMVSRLLENRFSVTATPSPGTQRARETADRAEWVLTYGAASIQERSGTDWQRALAEAASAYCYGVLHWRIAPELSAKTSDPKYLDDLKDDEKKSYQPTELSIGGELTKGKYRETAKATALRSAVAKSRSPFPFHVEIVAPDQVAFIDDESDQPGPGIVVHIKEVGIVDYNGELMKSGLLLKASAGSNRDIRLSLEEYDPQTQVAMERPAPSSGAPESPSISGWKQRIAIACVWTRGEYYELVSTALLSGASETIINQTKWVLVKAQKHGYGRCPFTRAYATKEESEWDPALRYRPALDGIYATKASFDYSRALWDRIATQLAIKKYFITQDVNSPPALAGDEDGDQIILTRDSAQAQVMPPGQSIQAIGPDDISPAFGKTLQMQAEEMRASAPPTGQTPITATTQPWNLRIGQVMANAYPAMVLGNVGTALVEMFRNWVEVAARPAEEGGLGVDLVAPGFTVNGKGAKQINRSGDPLVMDASDWEGIWIDVNISPVSSAERVTQIQLGQELLNNPIHVSTPEMFVGDDLGVQDATGHMKEVDAYWAIAAFKQGKTNQILSEFYGKQTLVSADGTMASGTGQAVNPMSVLAQNGVMPAPGGGQGQAPPLPGPNMPGLPALVGSGAPPLPGMGNV